MSTESSRRTLVLLVLVVILVVALNVFLLLDFGQSKFSVHWELWTVLTAFGTVGATVFSVITAWMGSRSKRDSVARLVSAWITDDYRFSEEHSGYVRTVTLHVANESNEPVYEAHASVHIHDGQVALGSLSAPSRIATVPPRRHLEFDITLPLAAHEHSATPQVEISFRDANSRRWNRDLSGVLIETTNLKSHWVTKTNNDERALGITDSPWNPMTVAMVFLNCLRDPSNSHVVDSFLLNNFGGGWTDQDWYELNAELSNYQPTSHINYPTSRIATVKLSGDPELEGKQVVGDHIKLANVRYLTLTLDLEEGWKVFSTGDFVPIEQIPFATVN